MELQQLRCGEECCSLTTTKNQGINQLSSRSCWRMCRDRREPASNGSNRQGKEVRMRRELSTLQFDTDKKYLEDKKILKESIDLV